MSPYTIVLRKFSGVLVNKAAWMSVKTVGKDSSYKSGGLDCVYGRKDNRMWTGSTFFEERVQVAELLPNSV